MSAPTVPAWWAPIKAYREGKGGFETRLEYLRYLAKGPDFHEEVQAARRLLLKDRYSQK